MRRWTAIAVLALVLGLAPTSAWADETVVVPGTSLPASGTSLTYFGCVDLFHVDQRGPQAMLRRDDAAPLGSRAVDLTLPGTQTAAGSASLFSSVSTAVSTLAVRGADGGSTGVAYVWYLAPGMARGQVWSGQANLTAAPGWQQVDTSTLTYRWTRYDSASGAVRGRGGSATIDAFTAAHGDGPGYVLVGFGCDGQTFSVDAIRTGLPGSVTTYDLDGWSVTTTIEATKGHVQPGEQVAISGVSEGLGRAMGATLTLQARPEGAAEFHTVAETVAAAADGTVTATVTPEVTTEYRWFFAGRSYANEHFSGIVRVEVTPAPGG
ncbi:hypothetical protein [Nocardioides sp.]|uniref:hypothetical protein n=1 Tax=Nocardioides sp. TaxID=35761 RepID=UPI002ED13761